MSLTRLWIPSPNYSSRSGSVRLIVLHTAEGARTIQSLGSFFGSSASQVSSHVGADDTPNTVGEFVHRDDKAWTVSAFNSEAVSIEQCAFVAWSPDEWMNHPNLLANTAAWIAEEAAHFGIPIVKLDDSQAQGSGRGVCQHSNLGAAGGGHNDCGPNFPIDHVLELARGGGQSQPEEENSLITSAVSHGGTLHVFELKNGIVYYTYQPSTGTAWRGGQAGKSVAEMSHFANAPDVVSIDANTAHDGTLHLFGRKKDGSVLYTYQKVNSTSWSGGLTGKTTAGFEPFAPAP